MQMRMRRAVLCLALAGRLGVATEASADGPPHRVRTLAGTGVAGVGGDGPATQNPLIRPRGIAAGAAGAVFIADGSRIRRVDPETGMISTIAELDGYECVIPPRQPLHVQALALDGARLYFSAARTDGVCSHIFRVDLASGEVDAVAGTQGPSGYAGDGGPALDAQLGSVVAGLAVDARGNLLIADSANRRIRRIDVQTGVIQTIAGTGEDGSTGDYGPARVASLQYPAAVAVDAAGHIYIADRLAHRVRKIDASNGVIYPMAGDGSIGSSGDSGPALAAQLDHPNGIVVDPAGNLWISTEGDGRIRVVDYTARSWPPGLIDTMIGGGSDPADGVGPREASLHSPQGIAIDGRGHIVWSEISWRVRRFDNRWPTIDAGPDVLVEEHEPIQVHARASDLDGDELDIRWYNEWGAFVGFGADLLYPFELGTSLFTVQARDTFGGVATDVVRVTILPLEPPRVAIVTPRDRPVREGEPLVIEWTASDNVGIEWLGILFSRNGGLIFEPIPGCEVLLPTARRCVWDAAPAATPDARIVVVAHDRRQQYAHDMASFSIVRSLPVGAGFGLTGTYYDETNFTVLRHRRLDPTVDFEWGAAPPAPGITPGPFAVRWTGLVEARDTEMYTFYTEAVGRVRLWIDGNLIIDRSTVDPTPVEGQGRIRLREGNRYSLRLEYVADVTPARVRLSWSNPIDARAVIPVAQLYPSAVYDDFNDGVADGWWKSSGIWHVVTDGTPVYRAAALYTPAGAISWQGSSGDTVVSARIKFASSGSGSRTVGLMTRFSGLDHHYLFVHENNTLKIVRRNNGVNTTLASASYSLSPWQWYAFSAEMRGSELRFRVNGALKVSASDTTFTYGYAGFYATGAEARFDDFLLGTTFR